VGNEPIYRMLAAFLGSPAGRLVPLSSGGVPLGSTPRQQPAVEELPMPQPMTGRMTFNRMAAHVRTTPQQDAESMAYERSESNRNELESAIRQERSQKNRMLLSDEYARLFGGMR
jgi:hypothetical protein